MNKDLNKSKEELIVELHALQKKHEALQALYQHDISKSIELSTIPLDSNKEQFRHLFDGAPDAIFLADPQTKKILEVNKSACKLLGKARNEIIGLYQHEIHHPKNKDFTSKWFDFHIQEAKIKGFTHPIENVVCHSNGTIIPVEILAQMIPFGHQMLLMGIFRDISDRKNTELALKESETKYRELFNANTDAIVLCKVSPNGKPSTIIEMNQSAIQLLGYNKDEIFKMNPDEFEQDTPLELSEKRHHDLKTKGYSNFETKIEHKNGTSLSVEIIIIQLTYFGQPAIMCIVRDITERKKHELQLQKYANELKKLNADKDLLMSVLAHDLKSPFNSLLGFSDLLKANVRNYSITKIEKQVNTINNSSHRFYNLLEDLLLWAQAQSGKLPFEPQSLKFKQICNEVLNDLNLIAINKNITIGKYEFKAFTLMADKEMLKTVLRNLISNAIKFTNTGGKIQIHATCTKSFITISVSDNGIGIKPDILDNLFDISIKHSTTGTVGENGTGLGLFLCKEFVTKHGGKIWAESMMGKGSRFYFTIPDYK